MINDSVSGNIDWVPCELPYSNQVNLGWWSIIPPPVYVPAITYTHVIVTQKAEVADADIDRIAERVADKIEERRKARKEGKQP